MIRDYSTTMTASLSGKSYKENDTLFLERSLDTSILLPNKTVGTSVPGWKNIIASGGNATSDFDGVETKVRVSDMNLRCSYIYDKRFYSVYSGSYLPTYKLGVDLSVLTRLNSMASAKAYQHARSGFNSVTFIGELSQTLSMMLNPANGLIKGIRAYASDADSLRKKFKKIGDIRRSIADLYLEYNFGWKPLFYDIQSAVESYNDVLSSAKSLHVSGTSKEKHRVSLQSSSFNLPGSRGANCHWVLDIENEYSVQWKGTILFKTPGSVSYNFGAGFPDFVPGIWNLLPWSFVVDYFANIGDILDSSAISSQVSWQYACATERVRSVVNGTFRAIPHWAVDVIVEKPGVFSAEHKTVKRRTAKVIPIPNFIFKVPSFKQGLNLSALLAVRKLVYK